MSIFDSIIIGLVQGLCEFLPVSSSGHIILAGKLLGLNEVPLSFELIMHLATLLAVIIVMRKSIVQVIKKPLKSPMLLIIVASVPTVIIAVVFEKFFKSAFDGSLLIPCFLVTAVLLMVTEIVSAKRNEKKPLQLLNKSPTFLDAIIIGVSQGIAVLPGISRSGTTISTARLLGVEKQASSQFSFLLSIPIILGSAAFELIKNGIGISVPVLVIIAGFISAFISGFIALKLMQKIAQKFSYEGFSIYLFLLSVFLIIDKFVLHIF